MIASSVISRRRQEPRGPTSSRRIADWLLAQFAPTRRLAQQRYRAFVDERLEHARATSTGQRLGNEPFLRNTFGYDPPLPEIPRNHIEPLPPTLTQIFSSTDPTPIKTAYRRHGYTLQQIAAFLGTHYSTISRRLHNQENTTHKQPHV